MGRQLETASKTSFKTGTPVPQTGSERFVVVDAEQTVWVLERLSGEGREASEGAVIPQKGFVVVEAEQHSRW